MADRASFNAFSPNNRDPDFSPYYFKINLRQSPNESVFSPEILRTWRSRALPCPEDNTTCQPFWAMSMDDYPREPLSCPFCSFDDYDGDFLIQHVNLCHPETELIRAYSTEEQNLDSAGEGAEDIGITTSSNESTSEVTLYTPCPLGCGELVLSVELATHLDLHAAETLMLDDLGVRDYENCSSEDLRENEQHRDQISKVIGDINLQGRHGKSIYASRAKGEARLGPAELGPYAHEKKMPSWLRKLLENGSKITKLNKIASNGTVVTDEVVENETRDEIPVLMQLCQQDATVQRALFCSPRVRHVFKLPREGGFCGYRNIQMLISYLKDSGGVAGENFPGRLPPIFELQDRIENAWAMGFNSTGKIDTGGIKGTRKYIGTSEAQALFASLGIECDASAFGNSQGSRAYDALLQDIASYFRSGYPLDNDKKILQTELPPVYFQHQGHSMTIVGFEVRKDGTANLLVFDPMFKTSPAVRNAIGGSITTQNPGKLLKVYRRGVPYLHKYPEFEVLKFRQ